MLPDFMLLHRNRLRRRPRHVSNAKKWLKRRRLIWRSRYVEREGERVQKVRRTAQNFHRFIDEDGDDDDLC